MIVTESMYERHNPQQTERTVADMTIRELYAGLAMCGLGQHGGWGTFENLADACFKLADAMIRRSEQTCNRQA